MKYVKAEASVIRFNHNEFMMSSGTWTDHTGNKSVCGGVTKGSGDWYNCNVFTKYNFAGQPMDESKYGFNCDSYVLP